jgi:hypothetical protein
MAVDRVPGAVLQTRVDGLPARDQVGIDLLHRLAGDETQGGIARSGHQVEAAAVHEGDHLVRGAGHLGVDLAAGLLLEIGHPVVVLVIGAALDVAGPGDDIDLAFSWPDLGHHVGLGRGCGEQCAQRRRRDCPRISPRHGSSCPSSLSLNSMGFAVPKLPRCPPLVKPDCAASRLRRWILQLPERRPARL